MATQIINDNSCIRIIKDDTTLLINKAQVRTIDTLQNDTVRIDIGKRSLRNVYIRLADVTAPAGLADVNALRDAIKAMFDNNGVDNNTLNGNIDQVKTMLGAMGQQITAIQQGIGSVAQAMAGLSTAQGLQTLQDAITNSGQNQLTQLGILSQMLADIKSMINGNNNFREPVLVDESVPMVVYNGFITPASGTDAVTANPIWAIQRVTRNGDMFTYEWADGSQQFTNIWDNRYNLKYQPLVK